MFTVPLGIAFGFSAALFQALSYVFSKHFFVRCRPSSQLLFAVGSAQMGLVAVLALPFLLDGPLPPFSEYGWELVGTAGFYLTAQWLLFVNLKRTDSSVVAPLLGLKIPLLGLISTVLLQQPLPATAWAAIAMCTAAVFLVSPPTSLPELGTLALILLTCLGYCGSDLCIPLLIGKLEGASRAPTLLAVSATYTVCGIVGVVMALRMKAFRVPGVHRHAAPYAASWLLGMCFLFAAFATIGVIFGNMLQSSRGLISVVLTALILRAGIRHLDAPTGKGRLALRATGAALMTAAIVLYYGTAIRT